MASKPKHSFWRKAVGLMLVLSFVLPVSYLPATSPRAQAFLGVGDINLESIPTIVSFLLESIGKQMAKKMVDDMVRSTIAWANSGFEGNPAFPTDWGRDLENIAKGVVGDYIVSSTTMGFLCSPFQAQIKLALITKHQPAENQFRCTLDDIGVNYDNFVNDFQSEGGGWEAWFQITQADQNNPYGAYLAVEADLNEKLAAKLKLEDGERAINNGFLNFSECDVVNTAPDGVDYKVFKKYYDDASAATKAALREENPGWDPDKDLGACLKEGPVKTPGSVISTQLNDALGSGLQGLIQADDVDALVSAFASGLLQRYVFGRSGLISDNASGASSREVIDVDGDKIPDGYDTGGGGPKGNLLDGELDICHHGLKTKPANWPAGQTWGPSNANCLGSSGIKNSPFFIPICESVSNAIYSVKNYLDFAKANKVEVIGYKGTTAITNDFNKNIWLNRTTSASGEMESLISTLSRYEVRAYDPALLALGRYSDFLGERISDLAEHGMLWHRDNAGEYGRLVTFTQDTLGYLVEFQSKIDQCENPSAEAIESIDPPQIDPPSDDEDDSGEEEDTNDSGEEDTEDTNRSDTENDPVQ